MKSKFTGFMWIPVLIATVCMLPGCNDTAKTDQDKDGTPKQKDLPEVVRMFYVKNDSVASFVPGEDEPADVPPEVHNQAGEDMIEDATANVRIDGQYVSPLAVEINGTALSVLETAANNLVCEPNCEDYMPAVSIIYAQEGSSLVLYYQPVRLCAVGDKKHGPKGWHRDYDLCMKGDVYKYAEDEFTPLNAEEIINKDRQVAAYQTIPNDEHPYGVEVKKEDGNWQPFTYEGEDSYAGSAKSVVYPVKQMMNLAGAGTLKLWNAWGKTGVKSDGVIHYYRKHEILLSNGDVSADDNDVTVHEAGKFSDLSHICPPSCNGARFMFYVNP